MPGYLWIIAALLYLGVAVYAFRLSLRGSLEDPIRHHSRDEVTGGDICLGLFVALLWPWYALCIGVGYSLWWIFDTFRRKGGKGLAKWAQR